MLNVVLARFPARHLAPAGQPSRMSGGTASVRGVAQSGSVPALGADPEALKFASDTTFPSEGQNGCEGQEWLSRPFLHSNVHRNVHSHPPLLSRRGTCAAHVAWDGVTAARRPGVGLVTQVAWRAPSDREQRVILQSGDLLLIDNVRAIHGRMGTRAAGDLHQFLIGRPGCAPMDAHLIRQWLTATLAGGPAA
jgi:hypothetical protein